LSFNQKIGDIFINYASRFDIYSSYVNNYDNAISELNKLKSQNKSFAKFLQNFSNDSRTRRLTIESILIMPVQRLPRYILLIKELSKHTWPRHGDYNNLINALQAMESIVSKINRQKRLSDSSLKLNQISTIVKGSVAFTEKAEVYFGEGVLQTKDVDFANIDKFDINDKSMECVYVFLFSNFLMKAKETFYCKTVKSL